MWLNFVLSHIYYTLFIFSVGTESYIKCVFIFITPLCNRRMFGTVVKWTIFLIFKLKTTAFFLALITQWKLFLIPIFETHIIFQFKYYQLTTSPRNTSFSNHFLCVDLFVVLFSSLPHLSKSSSFCSLWKFWVLLLCMHYHQPIFIEFVAASQNHFIFVVFWETCEQLLSETVWFSYFTPWKYNFSVLICTGCWDIRHI